MASSFSIDLEHDCGKIASGLTWLLLYINMLHLDMLLYINMLRSSHKTLNIFLMAYVWQIAGKYVTVRSDMENLK